MRLASPIRISKNSIKKILKNLQRIAFFFFLSQFQFNSILFQFLQSDSFSRVVTSTDWFQTSKLVMIDPIEKSAELASLKETSNSLGRLSQKWMGKSDSGKMAMCSTVLPDLNTVVSLIPSLELAIWSNNFE